MFSVSGPPPGGESTDTRAAEGFHSALLNPGAACVGVSCLSPSRALAAASLRPTDPDPRRTQAPARQSTASLLVALRPSRSRHPRRKNLREVSLASTFDSCEDARARGDCVTQA